MKIYVTFGQDHVHSINGITFDKDCVAVVECDNIDRCYHRVSKLFGRKYCTTYFERAINDKFMNYFPRGLIEVE